MNQKGRTSCAACLLLIVFFSLLTGGTLFAVDTSSTSNDLLVAAEPIIYGEESFRARILERTQGQREPLGLVLSGGSARAFAHLGVLQYLEENSIFPDFIISNSMGSIVGLLYAAGLSPAQIIQLAEGVNIGELFALTFPFEGGFLDTYHFGSVLSTFLGDNLRLEELPIPIMVVTEDLVTKRQVLLTEGDFQQVLQASFALPFYFPPVEYEHHRLLDGGITNLVPLSLAYDYSSQIIVSTTFYEGKNINLKNSTSILNVSIDIGKRRQGVLELLEHPEVTWIRCDVEDYSFMDFSALKEISQRGYLSAQQEASKLHNHTSGPMLEEYLARRQLFGERFPSILARYQLYEQVSTSQVSQHLFLGLESYHYPNDPYLLRNDNIVGLQYTLHWRKLDLSLDAGMGWVAISPMSVYPAAQVEMSFNLYPSGMVSGDFGLALRGNFPDYYSRFAFQDKRLFLESQITLLSLVAMEHTFTPSFELSHVLLTSGLSFSYQSQALKPLEFTVVGGWQLSGNYNRHFLFAQGGTVVPLLKGLNIGVALKGRFAVDGKGEVPFYAGDLFRTAQMDPLALSSPTDQALITAKAEVIWRPTERKAALGEMLFFEDSQVSLYTEMLWYQQGQIVPRFSTGVEVSTNLSLIGLKGMKLTSFVGFDQLNYNLIWGFVFGK